MNRQRIAVVASVVLLHALLLWGLQTGLLQRVLQAPQELLVPVAIVPEPTKTVVPKPAPPEPVPPPKPQRTPLPPAATPAPLPAVPAAPAPSPVAAVPSPAAEPNAPATPQATTGAATAAAAAPAVTASPPPATKVELPSSHADYLNNPAPVYPAASERRRESGLVLLAVLVDAQGRAKTVSIKTSSGYERLDQAALKAVSAWTFVPGKRNGVPVEMTVDVPIRFKPAE